MSIFHEWSVPVLIPIHKPFVTVHWCREVTESLWWEPGICPGQSTTVGQHGQGPRTVGTSNVLERHPRTSGGKNGKTFGISMLVPWLFQRDTNDCNMLGSSPSLLGPLWPYSLPSRGERSLDLMTGEQALHLLWPQWHTQHLALRTNPCWYQLPLYSRHGCKSHLV